MRDITYGALSMKKDYLVGFSKNQINKLRQIQ
jgi:hypothetical protein